MNSRSLPRHEPEHEPGFVLAGGSNSQEGSPTASVWEPERVQPLGWLDSKRGWVISPPPSAAAPTSPSSPVLTSPRPSGLANATVSQQPGLLPGGCPSASPALGAGPCVLPEGERFSPVSTPRHLCLHHLDSQPRLPICRLCPHQPRRPPSAGSTGCSRMLMALGFSCHCACPPAPAPRDRSPNWTHRRSLCSAAPPGFSCPSSMWWPPSSLPGRILGFITDLFPLRNLSAHLMDSKMTQKTFNQ